MLPIGDRLTGSFVPFSIADRSGYCFDISEVDDLTPSDKLTLSEDKVGVFQSCLNMKVLNIIPIQFTGFELSVFLLSVAGVILLCLYIRSAIKEILSEWNKSVTDELFSGLNEAIRKDEILAKLVQDQIEETDKEKIKLLKAEIFKSKRDRCNSIESRKVLETKLASQTSTITDQTTDQPSINSSDKIENNAVTQFFNGQWEKFRLWRKNRRKKINTRNLKAEKLKLFSKIKHLTKVIKNQENLLQRLDSEINPSSGYFPINAFRKKYENDVGLLIDGYQFAIGEALNNENLDLELDHNIYAKYLRLQSELNHSEREIDRLGIYGNKLKPIEGSKKTPYLKSRERWAYKFIIGSLSITLFFFALSTVPTAKNIPDGIYIKDAYSSEDDRHFNINGQALLKED